MRLIDADDLKTAFPCGEYVRTESVRATIDNMPTIEPERKTGKWINHRNDNGHNIADCSECGETLQWFDDGVEPNFCFNCGAKMEGIAE